MILYQSIISIYTRTCWPVQSKRLLHGSIAEVSLWRTTRQQGTCTPLGCAAPHTDRYGAMNSTINNCIYTSTTLKKLPSPPHDKIPLTSVFGSIAWAIARSSMISVSLSSSLRLRSSSLSSEALQYQKPKRHRKKTKTKKTYSVFLSSKYYRIWKRLQNLASAPLSCCFIVLLTIMPVATNLTPLYYCIIVWTPFDCPFIAVSKTQQCGMNAIDPTHTLSSGNMGP